MIPNTRLTSVLLLLEPREWPGAGAAELVATARRAEEAGFAGIVLADHIVIGPRTDRYPWGQFPVAEGTPWLEPLTTLAYLAGTTKTLRLCTGVVVAPVRAAALLAKTAATVDVLSAGRLELGVGVGWQLEEFEAVGAEFADRGRLLTDTIAACRALWSQESATFTSSTVSFAEIRSDPKPVRAGGPPVLFSGKLTGRNLSRIVELGDGWIPLTREPEESVAEGVGRLRSAFRAQGRDPAELRVRHNLPLVASKSGRLDFVATLEGAPSLVRAGATDLVVPFGAFVSELEDSPRWFAEADRALSAFAG